MQYIDIGERTMSSLVGISFFIVLHNISLESASERLIIELPKLSNYLVVDGTYTKTGGYY